MTMIEIVARAICESVGPEGSGDARSSMGNWPAWEDWVPQASAAIEALAANVTDEMIRAAIEDRAKDDEGTFPSLGDLIDFSGENKTRTVVRSALSASLRAALTEPAGGG